MQDNVSRRTFLGACGAAGAAVAIGEDSLAVAPAVASTPSWVDRPMRWAQLTLVEDDPGQFDLAFWLDYFRRTHSDARLPERRRLRRLLSHRGPVPPPQPVAGRPRSVRRAGRGLPQARHGRPRADRPARDLRRRPRSAIPTGSPSTPRASTRRHWASPEMWVTCALGPVQLRVHDRGAQGDHERATASTGSSSTAGPAPACATASIAGRTSEPRPGIDLPRTDDPQDPARRAYILWQQQRLFELWRLWDAEVRKINPDSCVIPNTGGGATSPLDMKAIGELAPTLFADRQARSGLMPPWANGKNRQGVPRHDGPQAGRRHLQRGRGGGLPLEGLGPERGGDPHLVRRRGRQRPAALVHQVLRHAPRPALARRRRGPLPLASPRRTYLRNEAPLARVGLVYSQQTAWFYGGPRARQKVEDHALGWYQALIEARIPFEMVHDRLLDADHLDRFKTLILPNIAALSDEQCRQLRAFVERGGSLVATYETSLYDEWGAPANGLRPGRPLRRLVSGPRRGPMRNAYLRLEDDPRTGQRHPILAGLDDAPRIIHGTYRLDVTPNREFPHPPLTLDPELSRPADGEGLPARRRRPTSPRCTCARSARGRVVYFPWDIDRIFWEVLAVDHGILLRNAVRWATNEEPPVRGHGPRRARRDRLAADGAR